MENKACNNVGWFFHYKNPVNFALAFYVAHITVYDTLRNYNSLFALITTLGNYIFLLLVINALPIIAKSFTKKSIVFMLCFIVVFTISFMVAPNEKILIEVLYAAIRFGFPCFFLGIAIIDTQDLMNKLRISSTVILVCIVLSLFVFKSNSILDTAYSQDMGYEALIPFVVFGGNFFNDKKVTNCAGAVVSMLFVFMSGARGPLFCMIISCLVVLFLLKKFDLKQMLLVMSLAAILLILTYLNYQGIIKGLITVFEKVGVSTRILYGLLNHDLSDDVMRGRLRAFAWSYAQNHLFIGTGMVNERNLIFQSLLSSSASSASGTYVHNFFLELMMQFGLVPGLIIGMVTCVNILKGFSDRYPFSGRLFLAVLLAIAFWPLMISRSYLNVAYFYLMIGYLFGMYKTMPQKNEYLI